MAAPQPPRTFVPQTGRSKKPAIPAVQASTVVDRRLATIIEPIKQNIEMITGVRGGRTEQLDNTADLDQVITKLNEVIAKINY